ncbi:MAG: efflux RND transporter permease subunit [Candidatus Sericytochromatia bacterium]
MFESLLKFSLRHRWGMMIAVAVILLLGVASFQKLPIDAVPDITNVQVQINTEAPGYSPLEAEQRVTFPIENVMAGLPGLETTRSVSRYGLSQVTVIFHDDTSIYFARQLVNERLQQVRSLLPPELNPEMGPIATGLGEIFLWTVDADPKALTPEGKAYSPADLRTLQDWVIKPQLRRVPGVTDVNTIGGDLRQFLVLPNPARLMAYGLSFRDLLTALDRNNRNAGAGYIEHNGEQYLMRSPGQVQTLPEIGAIRVKTSNGSSVRLRDVARIQEGTELRTGAATEDGHEVVLGTAFMLIGENSRTVSEAVSEKLKEVNHGLPKGVKATEVYNRSVLVDRTIETVKENLFAGALLVIVILFLFLGNFRAALITAMVIPLAMCLTLTGMVGSKLSANLMSLGALDFGIIVDGSVVIVENCLRHLAMAQHRLGRVLTGPERREVVFAAAKEARQALLFGELIIMIVYLPILTLSGVEGKMFRPMALTVVIALAAAMLLSMTIVPAAVALLVSGRVSEKENWLVAGAKRLYRPALETVMAYKLPVMVAAGVLVVLSALLAGKMGGEFMPSLDEGDIAMHALRIPGTSLTQAVHMQHALERKIKDVPEVQTVFAKIGTAEIATDPMPPSVADMMVIIKPRSQWPNPRLSKADLVKKLEAKSHEVMGNNYEFTQPIEMRFNELIAGVRSDLGVKVFGDDLEVMLEQAQAVAGVLQAIPGAADVKVEQATGLPVLTLQLKREAISRYGLDVEDVQDALQVATGGKSAGWVFDGDRRFELTVRLPEEIRTNRARLLELPVPLPGEPGRYVPLATLADFEVVVGRNMINREDGKRRVVVTANIRGRDLMSFVTEAQAAVVRQVALPTGYWIEWGGQFQQLVSASQRLQLVVPLALFLILGMLYTTLKNARDVFVVFSGVPLALTGGVALLWLRQMPLSITAAVGFIALSGVAVLNGLVMVSFINALMAEGRPLREAIVEGALTRLRPVLMTALVASLGFVPMAIANGTGSEVQRPLATVVIGGILSSTLLTLFVLPVLYSILHARAARVAPVFAHDEPEAIPALDLNGAATVAEASMPVPPEAPEAPDIPPPPPPPPRPSLPPIPAADSPADSGQAQHVEHKEAQTDEDA